MDVLQSTQFNAGEGVLLDTTLMGRVVRTRCSISSRIGLTASRGWHGSPLVCDHCARWSRIFSSSATSVGASVAVKCPTSSSRRGRALRMRDANARALAGVRYGARAPNRTVVGAVIRGRALRARTESPMPCL